MGGVNRSDTIKMKKTAMAYDAAAKKYSDRYAVMNFPEDW